MRILRFTSKASIILVRRLFKLFSFDFLRIFERTVPKLNF